MFFGPSAFQLRSKIGKKASPGRSKIKQKNGQHLDPILMDLGTNLARFWEGFGGQVGTKLGPNATKTRPQNQSKKLSLFGSPPDRFLMDFGSQEPFSNLLGSLSCWLLGPSWRQDGPKTPQEAPRGAQDSLQDRFWSHFGGFLVDFLVVF